MDNWCQARRSGDTLCTGDQCADSRDRTYRGCAMTADRDSWQSGFDAAIDEAIQMVDAMRAPGVANLAAPILLRIRAELIALRERQAIDARAA